jgi:hypothetical protein
MVPALVSQARMIILYPEGINGTDTASLPFLVGFHPLQIANTSRAIGGVMQLDQLPMLTGNANAGHFFGRKNYGNIPFREKCFLVR